MSWPRVAGQRAGHPQGGRQGEGISSWWHAVCSGRLGLGGSTGPSERAVWAGERRGFPHSGLPRPLTTDMLHEGYARASFFHVRRSTDKLSPEEAVTYRPISSKACDPPLQGPRGSPLNHLPDSCPSHRKLLESPFSQQCPFSALC